MDNMINHSKQTNIIYMLKIIYRESVGRHHKPYEVSVEVLYNQFGKLFGNTY